MISRSCRLDSILRATKRATYAQYVPCKDLTKPTYHSLNKNVHHLIEETEVVAGPEAVPQGEEEHGEGKRDTAVTKPLQTAVNVPVQISILS